MKVKTHKICAAPDCNKEFKLYKTTDKFCSPQCKSKNTKSKPRAAFKRIKPVGDKMKAKLAVYHKERIKFLNRPENKICPVTKKPTTEIHHKKGREGALLNDQKFWLAVSREGHTEIHDNINWSLDRGFIIKRLHK